MNYGQLSERLPLFRVRVPTDSGYFARRHVLRLQPTEVVVMVDFPGFGGGERDATITKRGVWLTMGRQVGSSEG